MSGNPDSRPNHSSPGVRNQISIAQSAPAKSRPCASTPCNLRRISSIPAPKLARASGSRLISRNSIAPARAARTSRLFCHVMPPLQTGHLVLYQTVSLECIGEHLHLNLIRGVLWFWKICSETKAAHMLTTLHKTSS